MGGGGGVGVQVKQNSLEHLESGLVVERLIYNELD